MLLKVRWKWNLLRFDSFANSSRLIFLFFSMDRHAFVISAVRVDEFDSGRQRKQGRKPADNADHGVEKKATFDRLGRRAGQMG